MTETKRRRADAVKLDRLLEKECAALVNKGIVPTARKLSQKLGCQTSTLTRDPVRTALIGKYRSEFEERKRWSKQLEKSSYRDGAEILQKKDLEIKRLNRQVDALLISHRTMIDVLRSHDTFEAWREFLKTFVEVEKELTDLNVFTVDENWKD